MAGLALSLLSHQSTFALAGPRLTDQVPEPAAALLRVRTPMGFGRDLIDDGYHRSATFRRLIDDLEAARSLLVLIEPGPCSDSRYRGCVWAVASSAHQRTVVIKIDPMRDTRDGLIAVLGHELQHAVEIADHPTVVDPETAQELFGGHVGACDHWAPCETAAAGDVERVIRRELGNRSAAPFSVAGR